jgi:hypothetical protein
MRTKTLNPATARPANAVHRITRSSPTRPACVVDGRMRSGRKIGGTGQRSQIIGNCAPPKPVTSLYQTGVIWTTV